VVTEGNLFIDAEAQIRGEAPAAASPAPPAEAVPPDKIAQMAAALAEDDLPAFVKTLEPGQPVPATLAEARRQFLPLANARAAAALQSRSKDFTVFECPMTGSAFPGAPASARWIQAAGTELRNPYLGREMQSCGNEVKP
ncbi:MAG TPA: hypothetical protein VIS74_06050, partial [Chthoniobacterales bacterium]